LSNDLSAEEMVILKDMMARGLLPAFYWRTWGGNDTFSGMGKSNGF